MASERARRVLRECRAPEHQCVRQNYWKDYIVTTLILQYVSLQAFLQFKTSQPGREGNNGGRLYSYAHASGTHSRRPLICRQPSRQVCAAVFRDMRPFLVCVYRLNSLHGPVAFDYITLKAGNVQFMVTREVVPSVSLVYLCSRAYIPSEADAQQCDGGHNCSY